MGLGKRGFNLLTHKLTPTHTHSAQLNLNMRENDEFYCHHHPKRRKFTDTEVKQTRQEPKADKRRKEMREKHKCMVSFVVFLKLRKLLIKIPNIDTYSLTLTFVIFLNLAIISQFVESDQLKDPVKR